MLDDHLVHGKWETLQSTEANIRGETESVRTTNVVSECDFALLDRFVREKPNASTLALEAHIIFSNNKTSSWLQAKPKEECNTLLNFARRMAPAHRRKFQERQKAIEKQRIEILAKKQADFELSQQRALEQKERYTTDIIKWGLYVAVQAGD